MLDVVGETTKGGDVFWAARDILLTIFLMILGEDQLRSLLSRLDVGNFEAVGVTGNGDFGLQEALSESYSQPT